MGGGVGRPVLSLFLHMCARRCSGVNMEIPSSYARPNLKF